MLWLFNNKYVSDSNVFKRLHKYATFGADSEIFWRCYQKQQNVIKWRYGMDRRIFHLVLRVVVVSNILMCHGFSMVMSFLALE